MSWSLEEMEAYVRLRKSLAGKSRNKKSSSSKLASSPKTVASVNLSLYDVDSLNAGHFELFSQSFDNRFEVLSNSILDRFNELAQTMSDRLSNPSFTAEPGVPVCKSDHGQYASLSSPDRADGCHRQFQELEGDPVRGSGYARPSSSGGCLGRDPSLGPAAVQSHSPPFGSSEPAQSRSLQHRHRVSFNASAGPSSVDPEGEEEEEDDDRDSVVSASTVFDKTFTRLISFVHDQYPESRPLSFPSLPPLCGFDSLFAVADPQGSSRPWPSTITKP